MYQALAGALDYPNSRIILSSLFAAEPTAARVASESDMQDARRSLDFIQEVVQRYCRPGERAKGADAALFSVNVKLLEKNGGFTGLTTTTALNGLSGCPEKLLENFLNNPGQLDMHGDTMGYMSSTAAFMRDWFQQHAAPPAPAPAPAPAPPRPAPRPYAPRPAPACTHYVYAPGIGIVPHPCR
jgi:hypothetical protein